MRAAHQLALGLLVVGRRTLETSSRSRGLGRNAARSGSCRRPAPDADGRDAASDRPRRSAGHAAARGSPCARLATLAGSIVAVITPGSVPPSARTTPHGSTISEWPKVSRPFSCRPPCAAANTKAAVLDGAGAQQRVPMRLAGLLGEGRRHGEERGAGFGQRAIQRRKAQVVADRQPEPAPRQVGDHGGLAGLVVGRFAIALAVVQVDVEHVDLVVARQHLALGSRSGTSG